MFAVPQSPEPSQSKSSTQSTDPRLSRRGPNLGATRVKRADGTISMPPSPALPASTPSLSASLSNSRLLQSPASFLLSQSTNSSLPLFNLSTALPTSYQNTHPSINETDAALAMYQLNQSLSSEAASERDTQSSRHYSENQSTNRSNGQSEFTSSVTEFNAEEEYLLSLVTGSLKSGLKRKGQTKNKKAKTPSKQTRRSKSQASPGASVDSSDEVLITRPPNISAAPARPQRSQRQAATRANVLLALGSDDESDSDTDQRRQRKPTSFKSGNSQLLRRLDVPLVSVDEASYSSDEMSDSSDENSERSTSHSSPPPPPAPPAPRHTLSVRALLKDNKRGEMSASRKAAIERARVEREAKAAADAERALNPLSEISSDSSPDRQLQSITETEETILSVNSDDEEAKYADQIDEIDRFDSDDEKLGENDENPDADINEPVGTLSMAPQMKIVNGQLVLNEDSLFLAAAEAPALESYTLVHENSTARLTSASFSKHTHSSKWTVEETALFYRSISQFGTDFDLICQQFPGRNRKQLKSKYKYEERVNRLLLDAALTRRLPIDVEQYEKLKQVKIEAEAAKKEATTEPTNERVQLSEV